MTRPARVLLQTTIPHIEDDWHIGRFSALQSHLSGLRARDGVPLFEVVARDRDPPGRPDSVLSKLDTLNFDELWLFAVDSGDGLTAEDCHGISQFRRRGGGIMVTRDHMDLGCSVCTIAGIGLAHYFHSKNLDPDESHHRRDDPYTTNISWPNYHSGRNGDYQEIKPVPPVHPVLRNPDDPGGFVRFLPSHPHEGGVGKPSNDRTARVIATSRSKVTGASFNIAVAFEPAGGLGPGIAQSTFHHFADYNWDVKMGSPSFVSEPPGTALVKSGEARRSVARYVGNVALWLAGRDVSELDSTAAELDRALDEALEETFPASDPPSITREP